MICFTFPKKKTQNSSLKQLKSKKIMLFHRLASCVENITPYLIIFNYYYNSDNFLISTAVMVMIKQN